MHVWPANDTAILMVNYRLLTFRMRFTLRDFIINYLSISRFQFSGKNGVYHSSHVCKCITEVSGA